MDNSKLTAINAGRLSATLFNKVLVGLSANRNKDSKWFKQIPLTALNNQ